jgi:heme/copper-type cytochrome/quinol oxidase subunit 1
LFALFAALYYCWPKVYGWRLDEWLGEITFWLTFAGFNVTFGMPRRVYTYPNAGALPLLNVVATAGAYLMLLGAIVFVANIAVSARRKVPAGDNPWHGYTLEWATSSPPPEHNFDRLPPIRSARPLYDVEHSKPGVAT